MIFKECLKNLDRLFLELEFGVRLKKKGKRLKGSLVGDKLFDDDIGDDFDDDEESEDEVVVWRKKRKVDKER